MIIVFFFVLIFIYVHLSQITAIITCMHHNPLKFYPPSTPNSRDSQNSFLIPEILVQSGLYHILVQYRKSLIAIIFVFDTLCP